MSETRWLDVAPERLTGWLERFAAAHGDLSWAGSDEVLTAAAADGTVATFELPFPPLGSSGGPAGDALVAHALRDRRVGVLLVRKGGHAAGVFEGTRLVTSKVGSRHVQGRSAAGGWSQQRFARRREAQARAALAAAAEVAAAVLAPAADRLDAVVLGGDRRAVERVLDDRRLAGLVPLVVGRHLDVPDPKLRVLQQSRRGFRAVRVRVARPAAA